MKPELLTVKQVAELTNYSVVSINRFIKKGTIKALRMPNGRKYMIEREEIYSVLNRQMPDNDEKFDL